MAFLTIAKRELRSYFDSPLAYVVICLSFAALGLLFFENWLFPGFWQEDRASMSKLFQFVAPCIAVVVVPVLTMRLVAEEKRSGTLEMLITLPVRDSDVILGKYMGAMTVVLVMIGATLFYPWVLFGFSRLGPLDWNPVYWGYLGLLLVSMASVALGLLVSTLTESQPIAFFVSFILQALLFGLGWIAHDKAGAAFDVINYIAFSSRLDGFQKGLVDSRDIVYFLTITVLSLMVAFRALERRKWA